MTWDRSIRQQKDSSLAAATAGTFLVALAISASLSLRQWELAGFAGALGLALWRQARIGNWRASVFVFDALAFVRALPTLSAPNQMLAAKASAIVVMT